MVEIVKLQMKEVQARLAEHGGLTIELTEAAQQWLATQGYDEDFGARPLKRALQRYVESPLSVRMLKGEFSAGDHICIDAADDQLTFALIEDEAKDTESTAEPVEELPEAA